MVKVSEEKEQAYSILLSIIDNLKLTKKERDGLVNCLNVISDKVLRPISKTSSEPSKAEPSK